MKIVLRVINSRWDWPWPCLMCEMNFRGGQVNVALCIPAGCRDIICSMIRCVMSYRTKRRYYRPTALCFRSLDLHAQIRFLLRTKIKSFQITHEAWSNRKQRWSHNGYRSQIHIRRIFLSLQQCPAVTSDLTNRYNLEFWKGSKGALQFFQRGGCVVCLAWCRL